MPQRQRGAVAILTAITLITILAIVGLALDLARLYNRKVEMQNAAATTALAAAAQLNGTADGVRAALTEASNRLTAPPPIGLTYQYGAEAMNWSNDAIEFGSSLNGQWVSATAAEAQPDGLLYVKVDTTRLQESYGAVRALLMHILPDAQETNVAGASAVAGRSTINVLPMGICAMQDQKDRNRVGELVEYGFRRGISYDLMDLNRDPNATGGLTYLINPMVVPGGVGGGAINLDVVKPFVCTGSMPMPRVAGGALQVESPFPLDALFGQLNSRFDTYVEPCNQYTAPPDSNLRQFVNTRAGVPWMFTVPAKSALRSTLEGRRWTIANLDDPPSGTADQYGPLWVYAKAARYAATEPANGYATFSTNDWKNLYTAGEPKATGYPSGTPYVDSVTLPSSGRKGMAHRRVLNVPLLSCPATGGTASVLGIGRFFMTVPATSTNLYAEFAGMVSDQKLGLQVELYK